MYYALQALESLYNSSNNTDAPEGFIIANDTDARRAYVIAQRCSLFGMPCQSLLVTCQKGERFPAVADESFDRVICDVPCSGDGTLRKDRYMCARVFFFLRKTRPMLSVFHPSLRRNGLSGLVAISGPPPPPPTRPREEKEAGSGGAERQGAEI